MAENQNNLYQSKPAIANKFLNPTGETSTLDEIITQVVPGTTLAETTSTPTKEYQSKPAVANKFLNTDGTYSTLDEILARTIGGITQFDVEVVEELPEVGEKGVLYLVPNEGSGGNIYDEYVWIPSTESFEKIGTTEIDLSGYEQLINKVTSISASSTDTQYPSAKLLYDQLALKLNTTDLGKVPHISLSDNQGTSNVSQYQGCIVFVESLTTTEPQVINDLFWVVPASVPFALRRVNPGLGSDGKPYISYLEYNIVDRDAHWAFRSEALMTGTTVIDNSSTDSQYPTAKAVYDQLATKVNKAGDTMTGALTTRALTVGNRIAGSDVGRGSFVSGYGTASGMESVAINNGIATNDFAFASNTSTASGVASHAEGGNTTASTYHAHSEGTSTLASGYSSHAEGGNTIAQRKYQHVEGEYNIADTTGNDTVEKGSYINIVGNGTDDNSRSNAHTLDWSGNAWFAGDVYVGSTSGTNKDAGSTKLAKDVVFTGTDGTSAGTSGLVPNPTVGDVDKYLKADGTWASVPNPSNITQQEIISLFS